MATPTTGFVKATSENLPFVDWFMVAEYFRKDCDYVYAEVKNVKTARAGRDSYIEEAIGYVELQRNGTYCSVKAKVTPEHKTRNPAYGVMVTVNEEEDAKEINSALCDGCAASAGGCKHAVAMVLWLYARSKEPATTSIACYWKKSALAAAGSTLEPVYVAEFPPQSASGSHCSRGADFLTEIQQHVSEHQLNIGSQLIRQLADLPLYHGVCIDVLLDQFLQSAPSSSCADEFLTYCKRNITSEQCEEVYQHTLHQSDEPLWHHVRYARVTASKLHEVAHCRIPNGSLVECILGARKLKPNDAMKRGQHLEAEVRRVVSRELGVTIDPCGIMITPHLPLFGASADGVCAEATIEIKCPASEEALKRYITRDNEVAARYMAQVQLQMHLLHKSKAYFCVADHGFEENEKIYILPVQYNKQYIHQLLDHAETFWKNAVYPHLNKSPI